MPFRHPDRSHDLETRIELEVRERVEEAVDAVCLQALVAGRAARGLPPPAADSPADRREFDAHVRALLASLDAEVEAGSPAPAAGEPAALLARQVRLARALPDYWQRFESLSARYLAVPGSASGGSASGGDGRGLLARLFRRG